MQWFRMHPAILQAFDRHRQQYEAERTLGMYQAILIGTKQEPTREFAREWLRQIELRAQGGFVRRVRGVRPRSIEELQGIEGLNVIVEP